MDSIRQCSFMSFLGVVIFEVALSRFNFVGSRLPVVALGRFLVCSKWSKIGLQELRICPEVRVYDDVIHLLIG